MYIATATYLDLPLPRLESALLKPVTDAEESIRYAEPESHSVINECDNMPG